MTKKLDISGMTNIVDSGTTAREFLEYKPPVKTPISSSPIASKTDSESTSDVSSVKAQKEAKPSNLATEETSKLASKLATEQPSKIEIDSFLLNAADKALKDASARFPAELVDLIEDTLGDIWKTYRKKVKKQDLHILAMSFLLIDFKEKGEKSILYKYLIGNK